MVARAQFVTYALDNEGRVIGGVTVEVRKPGLSDLITETIYNADDPDGATKTNPFVAPSDGKVEIWLVVPKIVDLFITKTGYDPVTHRATAHQLTAATLTLADNGTPLAQRAGVNFTGPFVLTDDAGNNETEIDADWAESGDLSTQAFGDAKDAGTGPEIPRSDHKHAMPADPVTAHVAAGDPHTGYALESLYDAKGDIVVASAADTPGREPVGADDTILMADAAGARGVKWASPQATPSTQAFADAAGGGTADTYTRGNHKHAMPANPVTAHEAAGDPHAGYRLESAPIVTADISNDQVTYAKIQNVSATDRLLGRDTAGAGDVEEITPAAARTMLAVPSDPHSLLGASHSDMAKALKTADEIVNTSTTLQNDDELFFTLGTGTWDIEVMLFMESGTTADFKWDFTATFGAGSRFGVHRHQLGAAASGDVDFGVATEAGAAAGYPGGTTPIFIKGNAVISSSSTFRLRWAQNSSVNVDTKVLAGSYMVARKLS